MGLIHNGGKNMVKVIDTYINSMVVLEAITFMYTGENILPSMYIVSTFISTNPLPR